MAQGSNPVGKASSPVWMRVLLGGSLALNLLIAGLVGGAIVRYGGVDGLRAPPRSMGAALFRELPREDRRALRDRSNGMMMSKGMNMNHHERQMAEAMAVSAAVRAEPFDRDALSAILKEQAKQREKFQQSVHQAWLERVANMSSAERQAYAARLEHSMSRYDAQSRRAMPRDQ